MTIGRGLRVLAALAVWVPAVAQTADNILLVINDAGPLSRRIGAYYVHKRLLAARNVCRIQTSTAESISWETYRDQIERPIAHCLAERHLAESVLYMVTTMEVPLRVNGKGSGPAKETCAVDSELALLYSKMKGRRFPQAGAVPNPFFGQRDVPFRHPAFPIYLVTRLAGYDFDEVRAVIDKAFAARNRGKFVIDLKPGGGDGNDWLRTAAMLLPANRVILDETAKVLYDLNDVIGYASWGSNDSNRHRRMTGFHWLPGAIATEFVSSDGRTFRRPPDSWNITTWKDPAHWFAGSPQSLTADYIHEGAAGCSGHVSEPYLAQTPRPEYVLPAYYSGRNLAESFYVAIPSLSWQNIVVGDPLCSLGKPQ